MPAMSRRWKLLKKTLLKSRSTSGCSVSTAAGPCSASSERSSCTVISHFPPSDCTHKHCSSTHFSVLESPHTSQGVQCCSQQARNGAAPAATHVMHHHLLLSTIQLQMGTHCISVALHPRLRLESAVTAHCHLRLIILSVQAHKRPAVFTFCLRMTSLCPTKLMAGRKQSHRFATVVMLDRSNSSEQYLPLTLVSGLNSL